MSKKRTMSKAGQKRYNWMREWKLGDLIQDKYGHKYIIKSLDLTKYCESWASHIARVPHRSPVWSYDHFPSDRCHSFLSAVLIDPANERNVVLMVNLTSKTECNLQERPDKETHIYLRSYARDENSHTDIPIPYWNTNQDGKVQSERARAQALHNEVWVEHNASSSKIAEYRDRVVSLFGPEDRRYSNATKLGPVECAKYIKDDWVSRKMPMSALPVLTHYKCELTGGPDDTGMLNLTITLPASWKSSNGTLHVRLYEHNEMEDGY